MTEKSEKERTKSDNPSASDLQKPEIFDSSKSNSMTDLKESATMGENNMQRALADNKKRKPLDPREVRL